MRPLAWAVVSLGLLVAAPTAGLAQQGRPGGAVELHRNYPNPFNPETWIPFTLDQSLFADGRKPVVSLKIYNVLAQLVAVPILQGSGEPLDNLALAWNGTGRYTGYWEGKYSNGREAPSGVYVYQIVVNGREKQSQKMTIIK